MKKIFYSPYYPLIEFGFFVIVYPEKYIGMEPESVKRINNETESELHPGCKWTSFKVLNELI